MSATTSTIILRHFIEVDGHLREGQPKTGFASADGAHTFMKPSQLSSDQYTLVELDAAQRAERQS